MALRGAIIGFGFISSKGHLPAYLNRKTQSGDVDIIAVADICDARLAEASRSIPSARLYRDGFELLKKEFHNLDFIDISAPPYIHAPLANAALEAGLHVLCEKPLATTVDEARRMIQNAVQYQRVLFPCHNYKHAPVVQEINRGLADGTLGPVKLVTLSTYRNTHARGSTEWNTHWRRFHKWSGGGIAMDHGSHTFYLTFDWLKGYPHSITAKMSNQSHGEYDTEDCFSAVLDFKNGIATTFLTWTAGIRKVIYSVQCEKGALTVQDDEIERAELQNWDDPSISHGARWNTQKSSITSHWMDSSHTSWFNSLFEQFKKSILEKDFLNKEILDSYYCIKTIQAAYESSALQSREVPITLDSF